MDREQLVMDYLSRQVRIFRKKEKYIQELLSEEEAIRMIKNFRKMLRGSEENAA